MGSNMGRRKLLVPVAQQVKTLGKLVAFSLCVCSFHIAMRSPGTMTALHMEQPVLFLSLNPYHLKRATGRKDFFGFMVAGDTGKDMAAVSLFTTG